MTEAWDRRAALAVCWTLIVGVFGLGIVVFWNALYFASWGAVAFIGLLSLAAACFAVTHVLVWLVRR